MAVRKRGQQIPPSAEKRDGGCIMATMAFARSETVQEIRDMWPSVRDVFEHHGLWRNGESLPPLRDRVIDEFKEKILDVTRPAFNASLRGLAEYPHPVILRWQNVNRKGLYRCLEHNIISADVFRLFTTAVLHYDEKMRKTLEDLDLGKRLRIVNRFLDARDLGSREVIGQFKRVLAFYGLPESLAKVPSKLSPDRTMDYKGRMLALLRPHLESDVVRRGLSLSREHDFEKVGLDQELLSDALSSGIVAERTLRRMTNIRQRETELAAQVTAQREEISEVTKKSSWHPKALRYGAMAGGGLALVNGGGIAYFWQDGSPLGVVMCVVNVIVGGLLVALSTGLWRPYEKEVEQPAVRKAAGRVKMLKREGDRVIVSSGSVDRDAPTLPDDGAEG
jgi:hypothetical protein